MAFVKSVPESEESVAAVVRRYPQQAVLVTELADVLMRSGDCAFISEQRELIGAYTSGTNNCTYCYDTHKPTAEAFGVDENLLESMLSDLDASAVDEKLKPILRYVRKLTETPSRMGQADVDAIGKSPNPTLPTLKHPAPSMHNCMFNTLFEVGSFYNAGGGEDLNKDPLIEPLGLTFLEQQDLVAFIESLSGDLLNTPEHVWDGEISTNYPAIENWREQSN